jgi:error-prone DNA polymerase
MPALALTDHDDLGGIVVFAQAADEMGIGGIVGVELTVFVGESGKGETGKGKRRGIGDSGLARRRTDREAIQSPSPISHLASHDPRPPTLDPRSSHLVLLAESRTGYGNLSQLVTRARMESERGHPGVSLDTLAAHAEGLHALTGCPRGWVPSLVRQGDIDGACAAVATLRDIFEGRVAIECWDHHLPLERRLTRELVAIARSFDMPWVVTNDVHYAAPDGAGRAVHDVLSALRHQRPLDEMGRRLRPNGEWYLKGAEQMLRRWRHAPEGVVATLAIAERCEFRLRELEPTLPAFPLPPGVTADEYLARLVEQGAWERWEDARTPAHDRQLEHELGMIRRLGLAGYFLIVWDIVRFARRTGVLCQGRGSAANSAVCFCLGITAIDPIKMELLFERFLSEGRKEAPDIDLDFAHQHREKVIQYVYERYGREHAAMVCEQITYRGRSAVRDAARVLGFTVDQANALSLLSDRFSAKATAEAMGMAGEERIGGESGIGDRVSGSEGSGLGGAGNGKGETRNGAGTQAGGRQIPDSRFPIPDALGSHLVPGTGATTRKREVDAATRKERMEGIRKPGSDEAGSGKGETGSTSAPFPISHFPFPAPAPAPAPERRLTSSDRPRPNAAYEPYGSPNAQSSGGTWMDPYASEDHVERRNPTTAARSSSGRRSMLEAAGLDPRDPRVRTLATIVGGMHGIPRHRSIHVGGFVLTREPLSTIVPIEPASMADRTVIQWDKDDVEAARLVKIDLLGLGMLTLIQFCIEYIRRTRGETFDLARMDMTDQAVYDDLCRADTIGVFQVESRAQMNTLPRLKPRCFYDLVVEVALIRPGPIQGEMVHPYLRRRAGEEPVTYPHPALEPILKRTLGIPLFQEQGMQVAIACASFTPGEADELRRAMGHKRSRERMSAICEKLVVGMQRNGIDEETARKIYNQINAFADYGFPESHSASFALLVYASAYLKHYYAPEFTAALLNAQPMGFYAPGTIIEDARRHGVKVRPVDVTRSGWDSTLESRDAGRATRDAGRSLQAQAAPPAPVPSSGIPQLFPRPASRVAHPALRLGIRLVRGLGPAAREQLQQALGQGGPFRSIHDLVARAGLDQRALRALAESGALDAFVPDEPVARRRRTALWRMLEAERGDAGPLAPAAPDLTVPAHMPAMAPVELTAADYRMTGISLLGHPMVHLRDVLQPNGVLTAREVNALPDASRNVAIAGLVICRQRPGTAKGFVFLTLEDETGLVNVVVTPKRFERQALMISTARLLLVRGSLQVEQSVVNLRGDHFRELKIEVGQNGTRSRDFH